MIVRVTITTEILDDGTRVRTRHTQASEQLVVTDLFVTRSAHRLAEQNADNTRLALQQQFGESDPKWLPRNGEDPS
jgi:hypothetical protein